MMPPTTALPLRPVPAGFTVRPATLADLDRVAQLFEAAAQHRGGRVRVREDDLRFRWLALDRLDETMLVEHPDGEPRLAAYAEFQVELDPFTGEAVAHIEARVHPAWTGHGLASFLLGHAEERARGAASAAGRTSVALFLTVVDGDERTRSFLGARGFEPVRHLLDLRLDLHAAPPAPAWPRGVRGRAFRPGHDEEAAWRVHQSAFADVATHLPIPLDDWVAERVDRDPLFDAGLFVLAQHDDEVVGIALCRAGALGSPEDGWIRDLAVLPSWRRKGVGMALLRTALEAFRKRGLTGAALEVDDTTVEGAVALYRRAGMRITHRTDLFRRILPVDAAEGAVAGLPLGEGAAGDAAPLDRSDPTTAPADPWPLDLSGAGFGDRPRPAGDDDPDPDDPDPDDPDPDEPDPDGSDDELDDGTPDPGGHPGA
jgi:mycothiol synthase